VGLVSVVDKLMLFQSWAKGTHLTAQVVLRKGNAAHGFNPSSPSSSAEGEGLSTETQTGLDLVLRIELVPLAWWNIST